MNNRPRNSSKTKNHKFWENFYWGNGGMASQEIIDNRDLFYSVFGNGTNRLKKEKYTTRLIEKHSNYCLFDKVLCPFELQDHSEYYNLGKVKMIMFHPYYISPEGLEKTVNNGFVEIKKMYSTDARSFLKIVGDEMFDLSPLLL
tara:strand:+ start:216 stop:647 length:432 start_codon:yes stop_codon:yes gene_type:complete